MNVLKISRWMRRGSLLFLSLSFLLTGCGKQEKAAPAAESSQVAEASSKPAQDEPKESSAQSEAPAATTVEITDAHGTHTVPSRPERVVSLDNRTFETLEDWGVKLAAVPKDVMPKSSGYVADEAVVNIGNHREPNLELIAAADPQVVIVGQRFASHYEDIKAIVPEAVVLDFNIDVSDKSQTPGENLRQGLVETTRSLGKIFDKEAEAEALVAKFETALNEAKTAYKPEDRVMAVIVSGGEIGYSAPKHGRVWGPLFELLSLTPALEVDASSSDHKGDDISLEAIAQSNPDWLLVLDRDAATASADKSAPAKDVIEGSETLKNTTAIQKNHIVYAPDDTYTNESIQTLTEILDRLKDAWKAPQA